MFSNLNIFCMHIHSTKAGGFPAILRAYICLCPAYTFVRRHLKSEIFFKFYGYGLRKNEKSYNIREIF